MGGDRGGAGSAAELRRPCARQQAPGFWAQKLSYFRPLEPADGGEVESGAAVPPAAFAVPSLDAPPVPPPVPVVVVGVVVVPVLGVLDPLPVPVEAVVPGVLLVPVPVEPVAPLEELAVGVGVGVAVDVPLVPLLPVLGLDVPLSVAGWS